MADVNLRIITASMLNLKISSNMNEFSAEKRFDKSLTIADFKGRLELITGASSGSMTLQAFNDNDEAVCALADNNALLGSFTIEDNYRIHVTDTCKKAGEFDDLSKVEKFELSDETYNARNDSVRSFLQKNKLGKYNAEEQAQFIKEKEEADKAEEEQAKTITVGERCETKTHGEPSRRGTVMFVGKTSFKPGWWVGVKYDEPLGKNDGSIGGKRYFEATMKYGGFVKPMNVEVGDFPEISYEDDEM